MGRRRVETIALLAFLALNAFPFAAATAEPVSTPSPSSTPSDATTSADDPTSQVRTVTFQGSYTGATYAPQNFQISQVIVRIAALRLGKSLVRISLPRYQTINGVYHGFGDMQAFYLIQHSTSSRSAFFGFSAQFPTASNSLLGTHKWLIGPAGAYIFVYHPRREIVGVLVQSAFSVAGPRSSPNQSVITVLPIGVFSIGRGWLVKWSEGPWVFDLQRGASVIPVGAGIGRLTKSGTTPVLISISDEISAIHANAPNAPKNTVRLVLTLLVAK